MLQEFYQQERTRQKEAREHTWLQDFKDGELEVFEDYLHKMVMSKNHEIYKQAQIKKNDPRASSESSFEESAEEGADSTDSEELQARLDKKNKPKIRASGVVFAVHIDPDAESEDEGADPRFAMKRRSTIDMLDQEEEAERVRKEKERVAFEKERKKKLKELSKNFDRKDKKATHKFLMKHGLTREEAREYTQLGTEFDLKMLPDEDKKILDKNFLAQVYAFRKLRERLLLSDNKANLYDQYELDNAAVVKAQEA